jgi:hypothetical protein
VESVVSVLAVRADQDRAVKTCGLKASECFGRLNHFANLPDPDSVPLTCISNCIQTSSMIVARIPYRMLIIRGTYNPEMMRAPHDQVKLSLLPLYIKEELRVINTVLRLILRLIFKVPRA